MISSFFHGDTVHARKDASGEATLCGAVQRQLPDNPLRGRPFHQCPICFEMMRRGMVPT